MNKYNILVIILGFLLGIYFYNSINVIYHGPNSNKIRKNVYKFDNKYYKFVPKMCIGHKINYF